MERERVRKRCFPRILVIIVLTYFSLQWVWKWFYFVPPILSSMSCKSMIIYFEKCAGVRDGIRARERNWTGVENGAEWTESGVSGSGVASCAAGPSGKRTKLAARIWLNTQISQCTTNRI